MIFERHLNGRVRGIKITKASCDFTLILSILLYVPHSLGRSAVRDEVIQ